MAWFIRAIRGGSDGRMGDVEYPTLELAREQVISTIVSQQEKGRAHETDSEGRIIIRDRGKMVDTIWIEDEHGFVAPVNLQEDV